MSPRFRDEDIVCSSAKCFVQIKVDDLSFASFIHQHSISIIEGHQIYQVWFTLSEAMLPVTWDLKDSFTKVTIWRNTSPTILFKERKSYRLGHIMGKKVHVWARKMRLPMAIPGNENGCPNLISYMHNSLFLTHALTSVFTGVPCPIFVSCVRDANLLPNLPLCYSVVLISWTSSSLL